MDEKLKQLIIDAFYHGAKYEKRKGHWITPLDFIEENEEQLKLYIVVGQSEQLNPEPQICYKSNEVCKYDCSGLFKESY